MTGRTAERLATAVNPVVEHVLRERGFALASTKTRITPRSQGVDLLGQTRRKSGGKLLPRPSPQRVNALLGKGRAAIKAQPQARAGAGIQPRNPWMRGWANDHRHGARAQTFRTVDGHISRRLRRWARRRPPQKSAGGGGQHDCPSTGPQPRVFTGKRRTQAGDVQPIRRYRAQAAEMTRHLKSTGAAHPSAPVWGPSCEERTTRLVRRDLPGAQRLRRRW
jgi:RNA-directed DNA polymerase